MENNKTEPTRNYRCCNYCKYYVPDPIGDPFGDHAGICQYNGKFKQDMMMNKYLKFYNWGCVIGYQHTIHNHYNLPYPQYANEYARAIKIRNDLMWDIYREKHRRGPIYMSKNFLTDLKNELDKTTFLQ